MAKNSGPAFSVLLPLETEGNQRMGRLEKFESIGEIRGWGCEDGDISGHDRS